MQKNETQKTAPEKDSGRMSCGVGATCAPTCRRVMEVSPRYAVRANGERDDV